MSIMLPEENKFAVSPPGTHASVCYRVIDLGTQSSEYNGETNIRKQIVLSWELSNELMEDGRPFTVQKFYTLSSDQKANLRKDLESWRGIPFSNDDFGKFDIGNLIGKPCMLGVINETKNGKTRAKVGSVLRLPKGMDVPKQVNESMYFSLNAFDQAVYDKLSDSMKAIIAKSPEYQHLKGATDLHAHADDGPLPTSRDIDPDAPF